MTTPDDPYAAPGPDATPPPATPPASPYGQPSSPYGQPAQPPAPGYGPPSVPGAAPGQPAYGQPAYGQPTYGQPTYGQPPAGTNGLAIASLVCAFVGIITCGVGSIVGFILGLVALSQIKRTKQGGRGLALAGVWISALIVVIWVVGGILAGVYVSNEIKKCDNGTYTSQEYQDKCVNGDFSSTN